MKIGVSSYSWSRYLREGKWDICGVIKATAEMGLDGVEAILADQAAANVKGRIEGALAG